MSYFWVDELRNLLVSDKDFLVQINTCNRIKKYIRAENPYNMLLNLVAGMLHGKEMVLLDSDFSNEELTALGIDLKAIEYEFEFNSQQVFSSLQEVAEQIRMEPWKLWLFTSGTTGLPKKVCHTFETLGRNVRCSSRYKNHVWAFAYRFSHMAGIQVLLQALINTNPIIYVFETNPQDVFLQIKKYHCTHISATPTFYRGLIPYIVDDLPDLTDLTMGGEKYNSDTYIRLHKLLPHVKIHNIYASTETGSILNTTTDYFEIPEKYKDKIIISGNNELLIHFSLLGEFPIEGEWYNTHDLVEEKDGKLVFLSRDSDLINVGGYKVNPLEVEEAILHVPGVLDCIVEGKANSVLGNILVAKILKKSEISEQELKRTMQSYLKERLQPFKVPRMIKFVQEMEHTRSGKKVRK